MLLQVRNLVLFYGILTAVTVANGDRGRARQKRVVGGAPLRAGEWPWLVSLHFQGKHSYQQLQNLKHLCGATLINPQWVLTAGHCVHKLSGDERLEDPKMWLAVLGEHDRTIKDHTEQVIPVVRIVQHPGYTLMPRLTRDIALLKLSHPANLTRYVHPIVLDKQIDLPAHTHLCQLDSRAKQKKVSSEMLSDQPVDSPPRRRARPLHPGPEQDPRVGRTLGGGSQPPYPPRAPHCSLDPHPASVDRLLERLNLGHECYTAGWGQHTSDNPGEPQYGNGTLVPHVLRMVRVPQVMCWSAYLFSWPLIDDTVLCYAAKKKGDNCRGDSGGPLLCYANDQPVLTGLVSAGKGCALPRYPGIYTRISTYFDWIHDIIINDDPAMGTTGV